MPLLVILQPPRYIPQHALPQFTWKQTLEALKELNKNYDDDEALKKAIAEVQSRQDRNDHDDDDKLSALQKENEELKKKVEVLQEENKQIKEERTALMKQLYAGFG